MLKSSHHYLEEQHIKNEVCIRNNFQLSMPGARKKKVWLACVSLSRDFSRYPPSGELSVRRLKRRNLVPWLFSFLFSGRSPGETHVRQKNLICYLSNNSKSVGSCFQGANWQPQLSTSFNLVPLIFSFFKIRWSHFQTREFFRSSGFRDERNQRVLPSE